MFKTALLSYMSSKLSSGYATLRQVTATALRPFFFSVHPDLFGQHPREKATNETSLKVLSEHLQQLHDNKRDIKPKRVTFYVRDINKTATGTNFRRVNISLLSTSVLGTVQDILKSCDLAYDHIDDIVDEPAKFPRPVDWDPTFYSFYGISKERPEVRYSQPTSIRTWMRTNVPKAIDLQLMNKPLLDEADRICYDLCQQLGLADIRWDSGWNTTQFLACLGAFQRMVDVHPCLRDRTVVFGAHSGVSVHGELLLSSEEVPQQWWRVLSTVEHQLESLKRIPSSEQRLSRILHGVEITTCNQHTHLQASVYEEQLKTLLCAMLLVDTSSLPKDSSHLNIAIESSGSCHVDSSGLFRLPYLHPAQLIVDFISDNAVAAAETAKDVYNNQKTETELVLQVVESYQLQSLKKDSNITVAMMIKCCMDLIDNPYEIQVSLKGCCIVVSVYYTVMQNGDMYIPWNWAEEIR